jgi:hypothetical protein
MVGEDAGVRSIFPVRDLGRALAHYRALGFKMDDVDDDTCSAVAERCGVVLHLVTRSGAAAPTVAYLQVAEADVLTVVWSLMSIDGMAAFPAPLQDG